MSWRAWKQLRTEMPQQVTQQIKVLINTLEATSADAFGALFIAIVCMKALTHYKPQCSVVKHCLCESIDTFLIKHSTACRFASASLPPLPDSLFRRCLFQVVHMQLHGLAASLLQVLHMQLHDLDMPTSAGKLLQLDRSLSWMPITAHFRGSSVVDQRISYFAAHHT